MALDPDIRDMLDRLAREQAAQQDEVTLDSSRRSYQDQYREMSKPPEQSVMENIVRLGAGRGDVSLHLYKPADAIGPLPIILYLHGGGFVLGDAETYALQSARIALQCGALVVFVEYRLAPEHPFPAAVDDALAAVDWVLAEAANHGGDPTCFALMGDSAGANLSIALMRHYRQQQLFRSVCLLYPLVDARPYLGLAPPSGSDREFATGYYLEFAETEYFAKAYLPDPVMAIDTRVSPVLATDLDDLPPVLFYAAENDVLRDQGQAFAEQLKTAGNDVRYRCFDGLIHNFMQHTGISKVSDAAFQEVCAAVRLALVGRDLR
ncbi:MAG TPA: alpha/beta hydrolase [Mesorhizobium sp.]|jgi:acetyl esterase|uniref:alpha/beta hydrolase n=1 Tax=Mesorhizobium sp. TaxID=1871066 RepID=UPI002DDD92FC|nr:alpha/beta hydrolase [Mesorhizobium sp.]HEV2504023.1 alpha/beta hydrolase [Mesorhizobium sp.]